MRKWAIAIIMAAVVSATMFASTAFAEYTVGEPDAGDPVDLAVTEQDLAKVDVLVRQMGPKRINFDINYDVLEEYAIQGDELHIYAYLKSGKGQYKMVKHEWTDMEEPSDEDYEGLFGVGKLKPNTKYNFRFVLKTAIEGYTRTINKTIWTAPEVIKKKSVNRSGSTYTWKKAKKAKGYVVSYKKKVYRGKNMYGVRVYEWKYDSKIVSKPKVSLKSDQILEKVVPFSKHGKYYHFGGYFSGTGYEKTKKAIKESFSHRSEDFYE